jgi:hypothetical protein
MKGEKHFDSGYRETPPLKNKKRINGDQKGCMLDLKPAPDERVDNRTEKSTCNM